MVSTSHNPDQYIASLRQIITQGRKRIGFLLGAGASVAVNDPSTGLPLIPAVKGLTDRVLARLGKEYGEPLSALVSQGGDPNIEWILSRVRNLAAVIGKTKIAGLDGDGYSDLAKAICEEIGTLVNRELPAGRTPYADFASWIAGADRRTAIEIFSTNYDLLVEESLERIKAPYFDGFVGANQPFFEPAAIANDELPPRWTRVWKLHGSLGWTSNNRGEVIRGSRDSNSQLIYPEQQKYALTQKGPYAALFDRLRAFLMDDDTVLIALGFSFADAHVTARIEECLTANPGAAVFAMQYGSLEAERCAVEVAQRRPNFSAYARDGAVINGVSANWEFGHLPSRDWERIRATFWHAPKAGEDAVFALGSFESFARFLAGAGLSLREDSDEVRTAPVLEAVA